MESVDYEHLFNDSNSKVWIVNKVVLDNAVISPAKNDDKHIMVFHSGWNCDYIALKDVTRKDPLKADYMLDSQKKTMVIEFSNDEIWRFDLAYLTEDSILMNPQKGSDYQMSIQLKPFPEL